MPGGARNKGGVSNTISGGSVTTTLGGAGTEIAGTPMVTLISAAAIAGTARDPSSVTMMAFFIHVPFLDDVPDDPICIENAMYIFKNTNL
jgi:hypothetical protein